MNDKREALAAYAHEAWAGWMEYLFRKSDKAPNGEVVISKPLVDRWVRQVQTRYEDLPENEKESDRAEADKILAIIQGDDDE